MSSLLSVSLSNSPARAANTHSTEHAEIMPAGEFHNFGPPAQVSTHRSAVIVETGNGEFKLLMNLSDWTGGYGIALVDPETGDTKFFKYPFEADDSPFASLYSSQGKFYNQFGNYFCEFDPKTGEFTAVEKTKDRVSMMMTEDDQGVIWMGSYPNAQLMSFDPKSRIFKEHGILNEESWPQYPRSLAADDAGWIYAGIAFTKCQIVAFNPKTGAVKKIAPDEERVSGSFDIRSPFHARSKQGTVWRAKDGKVYGRMPASPDRPWFRLHNGEAERVESVSDVTPLLEVAGSQFLFQGKIPGGGEIVDLDVPKGVFTLVKPDGSRKQVSFTYPSSGARIASMCMGPDGRCYGSTGHPLQFFALDPVTGKYAEAPDALGGHINAITSMGEDVYGAIYTQGVLVRHKAATKTDVLDIEKLTQAGEAVLRPFDLKGLSNGHELVMVGAPGYGLTGGGMLFYDTKSSQTTILQHKDVIPDHSTKVIVELPDGNLLGGTTIEAGTGGQPVAKEARLYMMSMPERKVVFNEVVLPKVPQYRDLFVTDEGLVLGLAGTYGLEKNADFTIGGDPLFFVFDPKKKKVIRQENLKALYGPLTGGQAPRVMTKGPDGKVYVIFRDCIVRFDPKTFKHEKVADTPTVAHVGIAMADDVLFFSSGGDVWGYRLPKAGKSLRSR